MKDFAQWALDTALARGASYAEVRVEDIRDRFLSTKNGRPAQVRESQSYGLGVRVIADGAWGFAATDDMTRAGVDRAAAQAVEIARASAFGNSNCLVEVEPWTGTVPVAAQAHGASAARPGHQP